MVPPGSQLWVVTGRPVPAGHGHCGWVLAAFGRRCGGRWLHGHCSTRPALALLEMTRPWHKTRPSAPSRDGETEEWRAQASLLAPELGARGAQGLRAGDRNQQPHSAPCSPATVGQLRGQVRGSVGQLCRGRDAQPRAVRLPRAAPGLCSSAEPLPRHRFRCAPRGQGGAGEMGRGCRAPLPAPRLGKG